MKKFFSLLFVLISLLTLLSCESKESCTQMTITPLTSNTSYNESIISYGTNFYRFEVSTAGTYTIALTNLTSNCDWALYDYISDCLNDYIETDPAPLYTSDNTGMDDDIQSQTLQPGIYLIAVDEWDDAGPATYTLEVQY